MSERKILLVGGGTGGHFYPLMAIAESLNTYPEYTLYYAGPDPYDAQSLNALGIRFMQIPAGKRRRYTSIKNFFDIFVTLYGLIVAWVRLFLLYPDVIVSKGGYTSIPVTILAIFYRIPIIMHDSDSKIGSANRLILKYAHSVVVAYDESLQEARTKNLNVYKFGIPIRNTLRTTPTADAIVTLGIDPNVPLILVIGGSQGAERLNQFIYDALDELLPSYTILHQTGPTHIQTAHIAADTLIQSSELRARYVPKPFLNATELNNAYHLAQIVISRAGSTSIFEIALHGKPSIIIPIPEDISHDQRTNAYAYARSGACVVIEEKNMGDNLLQAEIHRIMTDTIVYERMVEAARSFALPDASERVSALVHEVAENH
ncbi:MAG TPA: UDP-N-acetylglucosamine--N-acetylmuramyl-(pentapeptide) pyrophosphoryl-undecaprenol N-acetylglucosamine transferase [Candidatus Paceibacterota bacterium]|nr:UDP-N-acetylglucosamine--N-acetylmuramyl-(pentapeptide) pyrophosphoryl-undecaprenol N-acetylglucosamine transferase [Candidatus Paceibacterota bacterium]